MTVAPAARPTSHLTAQWRDRLTLALVLVAGCALTALAVSSMRQAEVLRLKERKNSAAQAIVSAFNLELTRTTEAIRNAALTMEASPQLTRDQFNHYMQKLIKNELSVNLMEWQPIVPAAQLSQFEAAARATGLSDYRVVQPNASQTGWEPVHGRDEYVPVLFAWPEQYRTIGLDMSFSPERMASKLQSRELKRPVASGTFQFMKEGMVDSGSTAIAISTTVFAADDTARGYIAAVVDLPTLFQGASHMAENTQHDLLVFAENDPGAKPIYTLQGQDSDLKQVADLLPIATPNDQTAVLEFGQRSWMVVLHPRPSFYTSASERGSTLTLAVGLGMTTLLLIGIFQLQRQNRRTRRAEIKASTALQLVEQQKRLLQEAQRIAHVGSWQIDMTNKQVVWSDEMYLMFGLPPGSPIPNYTEHQKLFTPESWDRLVAGNAHALETGFAYELELETIRADGSHGWILARGEPIRETRHSTFSLQGMAMDITKRKRAEIEVNLLAFYDSLTHLPNRRLVLDRLGQALASSARHKRYGALLFIDLDNFKNVNDALGHDAGDLLLLQVAQRLTNCVREGDTIGRLGGDEFVVLLEGLSEVMTVAATAAKFVGEKIRTALNQPYQLKSYLHYNTPSIGVTLFAGQAGSIEDLLKQADLAMYRAKTTGRNLLCFFDQNMQSIVATRSAMERDLHDAVLREHFSLHYQAQVDEAGVVIGAEALLRWQHSERGMVPPAEFIPLAEGNGLILPLGHWVLKTACHQLAAWAEQPDLAHLTVAVNVSARQFMLPGFVAEVLALLAHTGANPHRLKLELTESVLVHDVEDMIVKMTALKAEGVGFSLDDFGTGYSSLSYLNRLPLDQLKIDRSFVPNVTADNNNFAIAKMIVALADSMGLAVIAEGVETIEQKTFLSGLGCCLYQGYLFSQPLPINDFETFARQAGSCIGMYS